jgi:hypothetical protein
MEALQPRCMVMGPWRLSLIRWPSPGIRWPSPGKVPVAQPSGDEAAPRRGGPIMGTLFWPIGRVTLCEQPECPAGPRWHRGDGQRPVPKAPARHYQQILTRVPSACAGPGPEWMRRANAVRQALSLHPARTQATGRTPGHHGASISCIRCLWMRRKRVPIARTKARSCEISTQVASWSRISASSRSWPAMSTWLVGSSMR